MRIGIIGAGMAGLACAEGLAGQGHEVILVDKGRGPGGRMSTRRTATPAGEAQFDHGAQFFTARDAGFVRRVEAWIAQGVAAPWPAAGAEAFVGTPGINAPIRQMAAGQTVQWSTQVSRIEATQHGYRLHLADAAALEVEALILATPAEQAAALLDTLAPDLAARAAATPAEPCWTTMLAFSQTLAVSQDCWRSEGPIGWAARNTAKPGRTGPEAWVIQASPDWSRAWLEAEADEVTAQLSQALSDLLAIALPDPLSATSHRWRFARSGSEGSGSIYDPARRLGLCGDWLIGPRIEAAWLSGTALAESLRGASPA
jgi:hypothetical protein